MNATTTDAIDEALATLPHPSRDSTTDRHLRAQTHALIAITYALAALRQPAHSSTPPGLSRQGATS
jgi:hypothetical protein